MLQQLLDDREEIVRETVIRALSLVMALCEDPDKYFQCEELAFNILNDSSSNIINLTTQILFPVLGRWALSIGKTYIYVNKQRILFVVHSVIGCFFKFHLKVDVEESKVGRTS
jgi:hypothetical protein